MNIKVFNKVVLMLLLPLLTFAQKPAPPSPPPVPERPESKSLQNQIDKVISLELNAVNAQIKTLNNIRIVTTTVPRVEIRERPFEPLAINNAKATAERSKNILKEYKVDGNDKLSLENQFGNINVNVWNKHEIKVEIEIKAFERSDEKASELLESVTINESKQGNVISLVTRIARDKSDDSWWGTRKSGGNTERRGIQVNYNVFMPVKNALDISNKYGNITLPTLSGAIGINSSYGNFKGERLLNASNRIKVAYGNADVEALRSSNLDIAYGKLTLQSAEDLDASVSYSSAKIGKLSGDGDLNLRYCGDFKIDEVDKTVKKLNVNAAYSGVTLGFQPASSFNFDVTVSYCGFNYPEGRVVVVSQSPDENARGVHFTKNFKGQIGKGSDAWVVVNSRYGSVHFN